MKLYFARPSPDPAAARVRRRGALAPGSPRPALRRRPHLLVPVLLAPGGGPGGAAPSLPHRRRLVRGVEPQLLARVPRTGRGRDVGLAGAVAVRAGAAARILLLAALRASPSRRGSARRDHDAGGRLRGPARAPGRSVGRAARGLRGSAHPGEAGPGDRAGDRSGARPSPGPAGAHPRRRAGARGACSVAVRAHGLEERRSRFPGSWPPRWSRTPSPARCACCCPLGARATGWSWSRPRRTAPPASSSPATTTPRWSSSWTACNGYVAASDSPEDLADAMWAVYSRGDALRESTLAWFAANARRVSLARSQELVLEVYDSAERRADPPLVSG